MPGKPGEGTEELQLSFSRRPEHDVSSIELTHLETETLISCCEEAFHAENACQSSAEFCCHCPGGYTRQRHVGEGTRNHVTDALLSGVEIGIGP